MRRIIINKLSVTKYAVNNEPLVCDTWGTVNTPLRMIRRYLFLLMPTTDEGMSTCQFVATKNAEQVALRFDWDTFLVFGFHGIAW